MADPVSLSVMAGVGLASSLAGGLVGAAGAASSGTAQQQMYNYQGAVAQINSKIDLQNADYAINQGEQQATQYGMKEAQQFGQIRASQGASNIDVNSGSNAQVQSSERAVGAIDTTTIRSNAAKVAFDYDTKSTMDLNQSTLDTMAGINAKTAGDINATSSILGTVGSVATKWQQANTAGLFGGGGGGGGGSGNTGGGGPE